jgi:membrane protease YdiL (CAAX protease family)
MSRTRFSGKHIWIFFALTYGLSWLLWIPAALSGEDVNATAWLIPYVLGGFGPSVAGVIMVYRSREKEVRRDFWKRIIDFRRISVGWYLFILLVFPVLFAISLFLNSLFGNPLPSLDRLGQIGTSPLILVGMVVAGILTGPLSEELGWRGFALGRLQTRHSPLVSSLILALFWWGWHLPLFFMNGTTQHTWGFGTPSFWLFSIGIVPLSILLTWVYNHNGQSTLAAILLHFMYNLTLGLVYPFSVSIHFSHVVLLFVLAATMVLSDRSRLGRILSPDSGGALGAGGGDRSRTLGDPPGES